MRASFFAFGRAESLEWTLPFRVLRVTPVFNGYMKSLVTRTLKRLSKQDAVRRRYVRALDAVA